MTEGAGEPRTDDYLVHPAIDAPVASARWIGGASLGLVDASWPLASLRVNRDRLVLRVLILGTYEFTPEQVSHFESRWGALRIHHSNPDAPRKVVFGTFARPRRLIAKMAEVGFVPRGDEAVVRQRHGFPVRWWIIVAAILVWNGCFFLSNERLAVGFMLVMSSLILVSELFQELILEEGRKVGEIRPFLWLLVFVCGIILLAMR